MDRQKTNVETGARQKPVIENMQLKFKRCSEEAQLIRLQLVQLDFQVAGD